VSSVGTIRAGITRRLRGGTSGREEGACWEGNWSAIRPTKEEQE